MSAFVRQAIVPGRRGWSIGAIGGPLRARWLLCALALVVAIVALTIVGITTGRIAVPLERLLPALAGQGETVDLVVIGRRASRTLVGALVGLALGIAGAITQSLTRNPLASPDVLGVVAGAGVGAVAVITLELPDALGQVARPVAALVGALATTALVVWLSWRRGLDTMRLVLTGVGISAVAAALTALMLMRADLEEAAVATRWLAGTLEGSGWADVRMLAIAVGAGLVALALGGVPLANLRLGPDVARSLGIAVAPAQAVLVALAVVLVAIATAAAGPIGFVAFVAPQAAMRLFGTAGPPMLAGGLVGAVLVLGADLVAGMLPTTMPVGVVTSFVGGPVLLAILLRSMRTTSA